MINLLATPPAWGYIYIYIHLHSVCGSLMGFTLGIIWDIYIWVDIWWMVFVGGILVGVIHGYNYGI